MTPEERRRLQRVEALAERLLSTVEVLSEMTKSSQEMIGKMADYISANTALIQGTSDSLSSLVGTVSKLVRK